MGRIIRGRSFVSARSLWRRIHVSAPRLSLNLIGKFADKRLPETDISKIMFPNCIYVSRKGLETREEIGIRRNWCCNHKRFNQQGLDISRDLRHR